MRKTKHLVVLSLDAMGSIDWDDLIVQPNVKALLSKASFCKNVESIYPSLTYPAHTSIVTGCYPRKHGIVNNTRFQPKRKSPDWFWESKYIKVPSVIDQALAAGLKVAALMWPVTAKSKIQYNMPEIFSNRRWGNQIETSLRNGSTWYQLKMVAKFGKLLNGSRQPYLDNFVHASVKYTLATYKPDLTLVHFTDLDNKKHHYGIESSEAEEAIVRLDNRIGEIVATLKDSGMYEDTTLILLGDHSQFDSPHILYLNDVLREKGFLTSKDDRIIDYQAISKTCDGSTYIYLKNKNDTQLLSEVRAVLKELAAESGSGIAEIFSNEEAVALGADPECTLMLEAKKGYYFLNEVGLGYHRDVEIAARHEYTHALMAAHGYLPSLPDYQTIFIATGAGIKPGVEIDAMCLIDEGPTFATLLGLKLPDAEGQALQEILE